MSRNSRDTLKESVGFKVLSLFIIAIIIVLSAYTLFSVVREGGNAKERLREQGKMLAGLLSDNVIIGTFPKNEKMLKDISEGILGLQDVVSVSIYDADLTVRYAKNKASSKENMVPAWKSRVNDLKTMQSVNITETPQTFEFIKPIADKSVTDPDGALNDIRSGEDETSLVRGYVRIVLSKNSYQKAIRSLVVRNAVIMLVLIVSSIIIVYLAVKKVTRPLEKLTESVRALGEGMHVEKVPVETRDEIGNLASAFNTMVVARGQVEGYLRESEERYRRLVELSPDAIYVQCEGRIAFINAAGVKLFGARNPLELLEQPVPDFIHVDDRGIVQKKFLQLEEEKINAPLLRVRCLRIDGTLVDVEMAAAPFNLHGRAAVLVIARDISERKGMEDMIQSYQKELYSVASELSSIESRTEERERYLIAADLHDHVGQNLALSQMKLGALRGSLASSSLVGSLDQIRDLIGQTIQYTRSLTVELSPPVLYELGFEAAVEWLAANMQRAHGIPIGFMDDRQPKPLDNETRFLLFKIARELLLNIVKHSQARNASVSIERERDIIRILIIDNGIGFDMATVLKRKEGFGLFAIRKRLSAIAGRMEITSGPSQGTRVLLEAKLKNG